MDGVTEHSSGDSEKSKTKREYVPKCFLCGKFGHKRPDCLELSRKPQSLSSKVCFAFDSVLKPHGAIVDPNGEVNGSCAEVSLDTG